MTEYTVRRGKLEEYKWRAGQAWAFMYETMQVGRKLITDAVVTDGGVKVDRRLRGIKSLRISD